MEPRLEKYSLNYEIEVASIHLNIIVSVKTLMKYMGWIIPSKVYTDASNKHLVAFQSKNKPIAFFS